MKKLFISFILLFFVACGGSRHHILINDQKGFDTTWDGQNQVLKIAGWDKPFILFFFSSECGACKAQIPILNEIYAQNKDLKIIGVLNDASNFNDAMKILKDKGVEFPTTSDQRSVKYLAKVVGGVHGVPVSVIFNSKGKIAKRLLGLYPKNSIQKELRLASDL